MGNMESLNLNVEEESKNVNTYEVLPEGDYVVVITDAELKDNKSGSGSHIGITMQVIEGECSGRNLWSNFNIQNANATAEKIGRGELASLCKAINLANPTDTNDLVDNPFKVKLGIDKKDATKNRVKAYLPVDAPKTATAAPAVAPAPVATPAAAPAAPAAAPSSGKPWKKAKKAKSITATTSPLAANGFYR